VSARKLLRDVPKIPTGRPLHSESFTVLQDIFSAKNTSKAKVCHFVIVLAMLVPFFSAHGGYPEKIVLEEVLAIGSFDDDSLFQWVGVVADSEGNIYVTDAMDYSLKKFDADGNFLAKTGRRGQGPGEFTALRLVDSSEQFLFVTEQYQPVIKVFDKKLQYQFQIPLKGPAGDMKALGDNLVAVVVLSAKSESHLEFYDREGKIVKKLYFSERPFSILMDMVSFDVDGQGNLYLAYNFTDRIEKFDGSGKKVWQEFVGHQTGEKGKNIFSFRPHRNCLQGRCVGPVGERLCIGREIFQEPGSRCVCFEAGWGTFVNIDIA